MSSNVNMLEGPIQKNIIRFSIPLIISSFLSMTYSLCDQIILGRFVGTEALAAVSASSYPIGLINTLFAGLAVGVNIISARAAGSRDYQKISKVLHTSVGLGLVAGLILVLLGMVFAKPLLVLMKTPDEILGDSLLYMRLYFLGCPITFVSSFGGAILRSQGNTKTPMIYGAISGIANVMLNLILVVGFNMTIAGVAIATLISQFISFVLIMLTLMHPGVYGRLDIRRLTFDWDLIKTIIKVGIPAGLGSMVFTVSNAQQQSYINSFGTAAIAGNHAASSISGIIYCCIFSTMSSVAINFIGQNVGAGNLERAKEILKKCIWNVVVFGVSLSVLVFIFKTPLLHVYIDDDVAVEFGRKSMLISVLPMTIWGISEVFTGALRGYGYTMAPTIIPLISTCGVRFLWLTFIFPLLPVFQMVMAAGPVCGVITTSAQVIFYLMQKKKTNNFENIISEK